MIDALRPFFTFLRTRQVQTDNYIFRMHYQVSVVLLTISAFSITLKEFFGEPIQCIGGKDEYKDAINSYCWIYGTFTVANQMKGKEGIHVAQYGLGMSSGRDQEIHHLYYQWACFMLLLQAAMFYFPHSIWKMWEGGRLQILISDLVSPLVPETWTEQRKMQLIRYLCDGDLYNHSFYAYRFFICEVFNFINVICQVFMLDSFFGGHFWTYGAAVVSFYKNPRRDTVDPMSRVFPKVTKCLFRDYGPSGSVQDIDLLCVLPLNVVNEKIFFVVWFWLIIMAILSMLALTYRILTYTVPSLRVFQLSRFVKQTPKCYLTNIVHNFSIGSWFILHQLGKNMNAIIYRDLILEIAQQIDRTNSYPQL